MSSHSVSKSWEETTKSILDYLNAKMPDVSEVTKQEIAVHFSAMMAITVYDAYESWTRDFARAAKERRPYYRRYSTDEKGAETN